MISIIYKLYQSYRTRMLKIRLKKFGSLGVDFRSNGRVSYKIKNKDGLQVGNNVQLSGKLVVSARGRIVIGNNCSFRSNTYIGSKDLVKIGNSVFGAENVFISDNNNHPTSPLRRYEMTQSAPNSVAWKWERDDVAAMPVIIEDNVWLGRNCMILKGVTIGQGSIVAAGAVVTKSCPPFSVIAGNPARIVKELTNDWI